MSLGDPITAPIPLVGTSGTEYATEVNALLQEIVDRLEEDVPFSSLAGDELDMDNSPITNAQYLGLEEQVDTAAVPEGGAVYADGKWYLVDSTGAIQITSAGQLNAAAIGGIGGDYGGVNPASVRFVDISNRYELYDDYAGGAWAYLRCRGVDIAAGATSLFFAQLRYAGSATATFTLPPALPATANGVLVISSTGAILKNDATTGIVGNDIYLSGTKRVRELTKSISYCPSTNVDQLDAGTWSQLAAPYGGVKLTTTGQFYMQLRGIHESWTLKSLSVRMLKTSTGSANWTLYRVTDNAANSIAAGVASVASGLVTIANTFSHAVVAGRVYILVIGTGNNNDEVYNVTLGFDS